MIVLVAIAPRFLFETFPQLCCCGGVWGTARGPAWASRFRSRSASFAPFNVRDELERRLPLEPGTTITALKLSFPSEPHEQVRLDSFRSRVQVLQCLRIIVCPP